MSVTLLIGTDKGLFVGRSNEDRTAWTVEGPHFKGWKVTATGLSPSGRLFAATASQVYGCALHVTSDLAGEWTQIQNGPAYPEGGKRKMNQIWTFHMGAESHYVGVDEAGLFRSDDDGESWQPVESLNEHSTRDSWFPGNGGLCAHTVLVHPTDPNRMWCGISAVGVWRTDDGGRTWEPKNQGIRMVIEDAKFKDIGFCVHAMAQDPDDPNVLYRQDHTGMYKSVDAADNWVKSDGGMPSWFGFPVVLEPKTNALFAFPMESDEYRVPVEGKFRIYRSRDRAETWEPCAEGLPAHLSYAGVLRGSMAVDGLGGVYAGSTSGGVYASADAGDTWRPLPCTLPRVLNVEAYTGL